jgi:hypothetical protein
MKLRILIVLIIVMSLSGFGLWTLLDRKVLAQSRPVHISIPRTWGNVVGVVGMNILFEASDGTVREVSLVGGQATVVTVLNRY